MLWLAVVLPALPLEVFSVCSTPLAVVEHRTLVACNDCAQSYGLVPGCSVVQAYAVCPSLSLKPRDRLAEATLLESLAVFAYRLSPRVVVRHAGLLMHFTDHVSPIGDVHTLFSQVITQLQELGYRACVAIAPTAMAAWLCANAGASVVWTDKDPWKTLVRSLPLKPFLQAQDMKSACADLGLSLVGDLLDLPRIGLRRRFGGDIVQALDQLTGKHPEQHTFWAPPAVFRRRLVFSFVIDTEEALLFAIQRIVREWVMVLRDYGARMSQFTLEMGCDGQPPWQEHFTLTRPERRMPVLMRLVRERLRDGRPPAALTFVSIVSPLERSVEASLSFWDEEASSEAHAGELVDCLNARLGRGAVRALAWYPDYRPERLVVEIPWPSGERVSPGPVLCDRPLWLVDPPQLLRVVHQVPQLSGPLQIMGDAERIETGWWDGSVVRDYFIAAGSHNERVWIFRSADENWYLQGYFG